MGRTIAWVFRLIERIDRVPRQYFKKLTATDEIWECRVRTTRGSYRFFPFFGKGGHLNHDTWILETDQQDGYQGNPSCGTLSTAVF